MKKQFVITAACLIIVTVVTIIGLACGGESSKKKFTKIEDFSGTTIAVRFGGVFKGIIDAVIPDVSYSEHISIIDLIEMVRTGEVDAAAFDKPVAQSVIAQSDEFFIFPDIVARDYYGFAVAKGSQLGIDANAIVNELRDNGTLKKIEHDWLKRRAHERTMPQLTHNPNFDGSAGTLRYGYDPTLAPMSYQNHLGYPQGLDIDIVTRIAYELNMTLEFVPLAFRELLPTLAQGTVDMVGGCMSITEERQRNFDFVGPYLDGSIVLVIRRDRMGM